MRIFVAISCNFVNVLRSLALSRNSTITFCHIFVTFTFCSHCSHLSDLRLSLMPLSGSATVQALLALLAGLEHLVYLSLLCLRQSISEHAERRCFCITPWYLALCQYGNVHSFYTLVGLPFPHRWNSVLQIWRIVVDWDSAPTPSILPFFIGIG